VFIISTTAKNKKNKKKQKKKKPSSYVHAPFSTSGPAHPVGHATEKKRKEKRKEKRGKTYRVINFMPLAVQHWWSLCTSKRVVGRMSKSWEEHGWVMHAI